MGPQKYNINNSGTVRAIHSACDKGNLIMTIETFLTFLL